MKTKVLVKFTLLLCGLVSLSACSNLDDQDIDTRIVDMEVLTRGSIDDGDGSFVSSEKAIEIGGLFVDEIKGVKPSTKKRQKPSKPSLSINTVSKDGKPLMYVINYSNGGFVIVGASKNYYPILAYSEDCSFDLTTDLAGVQEWLNDTKDAIGTSDALADSVKAEMNALWDSYESSGCISSNSGSRAATRGNLTEAEIACYMRCEDLLNQYGYEGDEGWHFCPLADAKQVLADIGYSSLYDDLCYSSQFNHSTPSTSVLGWKYCTEKDVVGPLIQTSWHQDSPFNDYCHGHLAGCGAIAMAQVMNYHINNYNYPSQFTYDGNTYYGGNFPAAALVKYVYNAIGSEYIHIDIVNLEAVYTTPENMEDGIRNLGYSVSVSNDDPYRVEQEIMSGHRPVIMLGNDSNFSFLPSPASYAGDSHYWICDGIRRMTKGKLYIFTEWQPNGNGNFISGWGTIDNPNNYGGVVFTSSHMNWGWGGECNGWFVNNTKPNSSNEYDYPKADNDNDDDYKHVRKNFYIGWK